MAFSYNLLDTDRVNSGNSASVTVTTSAANAYLLLAVQCQSSITIGGCTATGASIGSLTKIDNWANDGGTNTFEQTYWFGKFLASTVSGEVITINNDTGGNLFVDAVELLGHNQTSLLFDANMPFHGDNSGGTLPVAINAADQSNDLFVAWFSRGSFPYSAAPAGSTELITTDDTMEHHYAVVPAGFGAFSVGDGNGENWRRGNSTAIVVPMGSGGGGGPTAKLNTGLHHVEAGSPMGKKTNGLIHPIRHGIVGHRGLILPRRVTHTRRAA